MIKISSFDKLVGVTLGTYRLEQFLGQSDVGPSFLVRADATTTYLLRFLVGSTTLTNIAGSICLPGTLSISGQPDCCFATSIHSTLA